MDLTEVAVWLAGADLKEALEFRVLIHQVASSESGVVVVDLEAGVIEADIEVVKQLWLHTANARIEREALAGLALSNLGRDWEVSSEEEETAFKAALAGIALSSDCEDAVQILGEEEDRRVAALDEAGASFFVSGRPSQPVRLDGLRVSAQTKLQ